MSSRSVLRLSIILHWGSVTLAIALSFALARYLPEPLQSWKAEDLAREMTVGDILALPILALCLLAAIVGSVGLLLLRKWAAWVYLASEAACYIVYPFTGPSVDHALSDTFDELSILLSGFVIGLAFFSDALSAKPTATAQSTEPAESRVASANG